MKLTKKFAEVLNGVDLSSRAVGDVLELPRHEARMLVSENWAVPADEAAEPPAPASPREHAHDRRGGRRRT